MKNKGKIIDSGSFNVGLILVLVGTVLLLQKLGFVFYSWVFTWPMILIVIGAIALVRHSFRSGFGFFMIGLGTFFLLKREGLLPLEYQPYLIPGALIVLGLYFIFFRSTYSSWDGSKWGKSSFKEVSDDFLYIDATFTSVDRKVVAPTFKGGKVNVSFGGVELDLSKSDISEKAELYMDVSFGGIELIVPAHWVVVMEVKNTFAGVEDKRIYPSTGQDPTKTLYIRGNVTFGGLEIKSF